VEGAVLHPGGQAAERAKAPKHESCSLPAQAGSWATTLPNAPVKALNQEALIRHIAACMGRWAMGHVRSYSLRLHTVWSEITVEPKLCSNRMYCRCGMGIRACIYIYIYSHFIFLPTVYCVFVSMADV
jgi:hypothetical protein